jgi:hypothetical protein
LGAFIEFAPLYCASCKTRCQCKSPRTKQPSACVNSVFNTSKRPYKRRKLAASYAGSWNDCKTRAEIARKTAKKAAGAQCGYRGIAGSAILRVFGRKKADSGSAFE